MADAFKDYIAIDMENDSLVMESLKEIEEILGNADASHIRIRFLMELLDMSGQTPGLSINLIPDPLTADQHAKCIEKGIIRSVSDGDVSSEQILKLVHSIEGLENFSNMLLEIPKSRHAVCWAKAEEASFRMPHIDVLEIIGTRQGAGINERLASEWVSLLQTLFPTGRKVALGFRSAVKSDVKGKSSLESPLPKRSALLNLLNELPAVVDAIQDAEIKDLMERFPWEDVSETVKNSVSIHEFLQNTKEIPGKSYSNSELKSLERYFSDEDSQNEGKTGEYKILALIFRSAVW